MAKRKAVQSDIFTDRADDLPLFSKSPMAADSSEFAPKPVAGQSTLFDRDIDDLANGARAKRKKKAQIDLLKKNKPSIAGVNFSDVLDRASKNAFSDRASKPAGDDAADLPLFATRDDRPIYQCAQCRKTVHYAGFATGAPLCEECIPDPRD